MNINPEINNSVKNTQELKKTEKDVSSVPKEKNIEIGNGDQITISDEGKNLSAALKDLSMYIQENKSPGYFPIEYQKAEISSLVKDFNQENSLGLDQKFEEQLAGSEGYVSKVSFDSGSVFDFLTDSDRKQLKEAYSYAETNGDELEDIGKAAFLVGLSRRREAMESAGVRFESLSIDSDEIRNFNLENFDARRNEYESTNEGGSNIELEESEGIVSIFEENPFLKDFRDRVLSLI